MADIHLIKLCVGIKSVEQLQQVQADRLASARHGKGRLWHRTRNTPRRMAELVEGGSIYWIIGGAIRARQRILGHDHYHDEDGKRHCLLLLDREIVQTAAWPHRAFQGWRYLIPDDAPPDLAEGDQSADMPAELARELKNLGLL
jgi:hypothetical protein